MISLVHHSRFALFVSAAAFLAAGNCPMVYSQDRAETTTPAAPVSQPQYASITSANNTVQISRLPVTYNGKLYYEDVNLILDFTVNTGVNPVEATLTVKPETTASPTILTNNFKAGTYIGPSDVNGDKSIIVISGPAASPGGGSQWTLTTNSASSTFTYPSSSTWYNEAITANPLYSRLKTAGITSTQFSYGTGDSGSNPGAHWPTNALLGYSQVGNTLTISSFTYSDCCSNHDTNTPEDQITYTLEP